MNVPLIFIPIVLAQFQFSFGNQVVRARNAHLPLELNDDEAKYLANLSDVTHLQEVFDKLLVPRVVGTPGHENVYQYITKEMKEQGWDVETDEFESETPNFGVLTFKNIIATLNPDATRYLVLACHYDSKYFKAFDFIGATDSAVPCAMMINLAKVMKTELDKIKGQNDLTLKFIFFDGEEAFHQWGPNDSIYGAKHLAEKWQNSLRATTVGEVVTDLHRIDALVLLDLIGAKDPKFYCFFEATQRWYERLSDAEDWLSSLGQLKNYKSTYFNRKNSFSFIEDDHIPFLTRRVPVLHLIPTPFPKEWHTEADDAKIVDIDTVENLNKILRIFIAEYLHLSVLI